MKMMKRALSAALLLASLSSLAAPALAHGGIFPPGGGSGGCPSVPPSPQNTPPAGPAGPSATAPTGKPASPRAPATPLFGSGPSSPASGGAAPLTGSQFLLAPPAASGWSDWWETNKGPVLALKGSLFAIPISTGSDDFFLGHGEREDVQTRRPTQAEIERIAVPALRAAVQGDEAVDIVSGALMALAKIGRNGANNDSGQFTRLFVDRLDDGSQEIRETAAIALGVLGDPASREVLTALLGDEPFGRSLVKKPRVGDRTRAFAAFGLGLYGRSTSEPARRAGVVRELARVLDSGTRATPDLEVACITALGLVPLAADTSDSLSTIGSPGLASPGPASPGPAAPRRGPTSSRASIETLHDQVAMLLDLLEDRRRDRHVRAHVPAALVRLCTGAATTDPEVRLLVQARLIKLLRRGSKAEREVVQGAILALGELGTAADLELHEALGDVLASAAGDVERNFALIALGRIGGRAGGPGSDLGAREITATLLQNLAREKQTRRAWAALALGIQAYGMRATGAEPSAGAIRALRAELSNATSPEIVGATAVALGLMNDRDTLELLLKKLEQVSDDRARGYLCVGLGLLGDVRATPVLQQLARESQYRPLLLTQAAIGLGLLADARAVPQLIRMLESAPSLSSQAAIATALGSIGDSRSFLPLAGFLADETKTTTARAFAAVALGIAADTELLPWNEVLRTGVQYRAVTVTLRNPTSGTGVLDIL